MILAAFKRGDLRVAEEGGTWGLVLDKSGKSFKDSNVLPAQNMQKYLHCDLKEKSSNASFYKGCVIDSAPCQI